MRGGGIRPTAHFQSFSSLEEDWNASLRNPRETHAAHSLDDVIPLIRAAESASKSGSWVALAVSYDAAPAFDRALHSKRMPELPLAWCAIFDERSSASCTVAPRDTIPPRMVPLISREEYSAAFARIRRYIAAGDSYQVNFTYPSRLRLGEDDFDFFCSVGESQGACYSAYLDLGTHRILSFSPELFFRREGDVITTRPMKGTAPRGRWTAEDDERAAALSTSPKDRAENVMIVDLLRSDLGRIAETGSVSVDRLFAVERINRVLQLTSTVSAKARPGTTLADIFCALFPCGSVTGAPKPRTMAIIEELERFPRGIYTGAVGLISPGGDAVFNVPIRTLVSDAMTGEAVFGVGGGITWDSTSEGEYDETLLKASFLGAARRDFDLLETIALANSEYALLERHVARMCDSASYFEFRFNEPDLRAGLDSFARKHAAGSWRVRVSASRTGQIRIEATELPPPRRTPLLVKLAASPIDHLDPLIYHKTTRREGYERELTASQPCDDVIFWNSRREITESTIANVVFHSGGEDCTPPREAGLLAGTLRDELLERGELFERTITVDDLTDAGTFFLINSVRGRMAARLV